MKAVRGVGKPEIKFVEKEEGIVRWRQKPSDTWRKYWGWQLFVNQGWRDAELLAASGSDFLFEYTMPNYKSYFLEVGLEDSGKFSAHSKSINQKRLPQKWQLAESLVWFDWQSKVA